MTTQSQTTNAGTDALPTDAGFLGTDGEGHEHYHSRITDAVFVMRDGRAERHDLHDRALSEWVAFVDEVRGWSECRYDEAGIGGLFEKIEVGD